MRITDRQFLECYCDWGSHVNWYTASVLLQQMDRVSSLEVKKALYVKIFFEYVQACEHFLVLVDATKNASTLAGLKKKIVKCPSGSDAFRYLWRDLPRFKKAPFRLYAYLGIKMSKKRYVSDKKALDGFYNALLACLRNRYASSRTGRVSKVMRAFNKIKHGFPIHSVRSSDDIYIFLSAGSKITKVPFRFDRQFAHKLCGSLEAIRNSMMNLSAMLLAR